MSYSPFTAMTFVGRFQLWSYTVSHATLHLRSPASLDRGTQIDVLFVGVEAVQLPTTFTNLAITVELGPGPLKAYRIVFDGGEGRIVAGNVVAKAWDGHHNDPHPWAQGDARVVVVPDHFLLRCLARVRTRPGMYLGDERVRTLGTFLAGYQNSMVDLGDRSFGDVLTEFREWLSLEMKETRSLGWTELIELEDASERNVYAFFERFEAFLKTRGQTLDAWKPTWAK